LKIKGEDKMYPYTKPEGKAETCPDKKQAGSIMLKESTMYEFRLYVVGRTPKSIMAIENLKKLLEGALDGHYHLEVIDVTANPEVAEKDKIVATPTLTKVSPGPAGKVVGDLSNKDAVLFALGLTTPF